MGLHRTGRNRNRRAILNLEMPVINRGRRGRRVSIGVGVIRGCEPGLKISWPRMVVGRERRTQTAWVPRLSAILARSRQENHSASAREQGCEGREGVCRRRTGFGPTGSTFCRCLVPGSGPTDVERLVQVERPAGEILGELNVRQDGSGRRSLGAARPRDSDGEV